MPRILKWKAVAMSFGSSILSHADDILPAENPLVKWSKAALVMLYGTTLGKAWNEAQEDTLTTHPTHKEFFQVEKLE